MGEFKFMAVVGSPGEKPPHFDPVVNIWNKPRASWNTLEYLPRTPDKTPLHEAATEQAVTSKILEYKYKIYLNHSNKRLTDLHAER